MEELLLRLIQQNEKLLDAIESIATRLEVLDSKLDSIEVAICQNLNSINGELDWNTDASAVGQVLKALDSIKEEFNWTRDSSAFGQLLTAIERRD